MKDAAANSTFGMKDAATATLNFARAGLSAEEAAAALAPAMNLAAGEGGNLDTVPCEEPTGRSTGDRVFIMPPGVKRRKRGLP